MCKGTAHHQHILTCLATVFPVLKDVVAADLALIPSFGFVLISRVLHMAYSDSPIY